MISFPPMPPGQLPIDTAHLAALVGLVMAHKPDAVLEVGVGTGYATEGLLDALEFNQKGTLTCVDQWSDHGWAEPAFVGPLRARGAKIVVSSEADFVHTLAPNNYDVIVNDADHYHAHEWVSQYVAATRPGGLLFFHDVTYPDFSNLGTIPTQLRDLGLFCRVFNLSSRPDERCSRGWAVAFKPD